MLRKWIVARLVEEKYEILAETRDEAMRSSKDDPGVACVTRRVCNADAVIKVDPEQTRAEQG